MKAKVRIKEVWGYEILDSRGNPTVEVEVLLEDSSCGRAAVPSGASTGAFEALELRDRDKRYKGKGVQKAVDNVNNIIAPELKGKGINSQEELDEKLKELDGTENKSRLGANAILGVSLAFAKAAAESLKIPLFRYISKISELKEAMPLPLMNILNGGVHAPNDLDIQEFMIIPLSTKFKEALRIGVEVFHTLKEVLKERKLNTAVGDEGGFAPEISESEEALKLIAQACERSGYTSGKEVFIALDVAASELYDSRKGRYFLEGKELNNDELIETYEGWIKEFPIVSIEDGLDQEDWEGWQKMTQRLNIQLVGDDIFVTNTERLSKGIKLKAANSILIKPNQIGTLTETLDAIRLAKDSGFNSIISHRSGETEDTFIADLAVGTGCGQIKTGAPCRGERTAKYNQLLRLEERFDLKLQGKPWERFQGM
jgi:enolase